MKTRTRDPVEVLVIGSGVAGSTLAAELAEFGFAVLSLEAGPERRPPRHGELADLGAPLEVGWASRGRRGRFRRRFQLRDGWGTGGAGLHWYANWYRFHEEDFKERTLYGKGLDWPIEYSDLRPWYDQAQEYSFENTGRRGFGQFKQSSLNHVIPAWTAGIQVYMDVSGCILASLDAGHPCRHDGDLYFMFCRRA